VDHEQPATPINLIKFYYELAKPGIVYGNILTATAGFFFAQEGAVDWPLFVAMLTGLSLIVASAAAANNYLDRDIDALMERTKNRALVIGAIRPKNALIFAALLGLAGSAMLLFYTNLLTFGVAVLGWFVYVAMYTPLKRRSAYSLFVGAIAGAVPPVVGYLAVTPRLNLVVFSIFTFLFIWQIAHFMAIAIYRYDEYANAGIPLLITKPPSPRVRHLARTGFFLSLIVIVIASAVLTLG
jgi:protoheme IX farnesyltransferase